MPGAALCLQTSWQHRPWRWALGLDPFLEGPVGNPIHVCCVGFVAFQCLVKMLCSTRLGVSWEYMYMKSMLLPLLTNLLSSS